MAEKAKLVGRFCRLQVGEFWLQNEFLADKEHFYTPCQK